MQMGQFVRSTPGKIVGFDPAFADQNELWLQVSTPVTLSNTTFKFAHLQIICTSEIRTSAHRPHVPASKIRGYSHPHICTFAHPHITHPSR